MTVPRAQNVLISAATTAHLADFESVREERTGASRTYSRSASRSGSAVATRKYEAPEMRASTVPKATAASDMYSYGVCALLACCDGSGVVFDAETEALRSWDREHAHAKGGPHLPSLLDELLDELRLLRRERVELLLIGQEQVALCKVDLVALGARHRNGQSARKLV